MDINDLLAEPYAGNYHSDGPLIKSLFNFASDVTNTRTDRAKAIRRIDTVMGCSEDSDGLSDEELVAQFERDCQEMESPLTFHLPKP